MKSKEWHLNRIEELKFLRQISLDKQIRLHGTFIALLSVTAVFFIFELQKKEINITNLISLAICIVVSLIMINTGDTSLKAYDELIQKNYDVLLDEK